MARPIYFLRQADNWLKIFARLSCDFDKGSGKSLSNFCSSFSCWRKLCGNILLWGCKKEKEVPRFVLVMLMVYATYSLSARCWSGKVHILLKIWCFFTADIEWGGLTTLPSMSTLTECALPKNCKIRILLDFFSFDLLIREFEDTFNYPFLFGIEFTTACYLKSLELKQQRVCLVMIWKQEWT